MSKQSKILLVSLVLFIIFELLIIFIPKLSKKEFLPIGSIVLWSILFVFIEMFIVIIIIKFLPQIEVFLGMREKIEEKLPYANTEECRMHILNKFRNDTTNPINLTLHEDRFEGITKVGKETDPTYVYFVKLRDINPIRMYKDIYYVCCRIMELDFIISKKISFQMDYEEEQRLISNLSNKLAKSPDDKIVSEIKIEKTPYGNVIETHKTTGKSMIQDGEEM